MPSFHLKSIYVTLVTVLVRLIIKSRRLVNTWIPHELVISRKQAAFQMNLQGVSLIPRISISYEITPNSQKKALSLLQKYIQIGKKSSQKRKKEKMYSDRARSLSFQRRKREEN